MNDQPQKKYRNATALCALATAAALLVAGAAQSLKREAVQAQGQPVSTKNSFSSYYTPKASASQEIPGASLPVTQEEERYRVTLYEGKIGVFRGGEDEPFLIADVSAYLLPEEDVEILRRGIEVDSFTGVKQVLEDYR